MFDRLKFARQRLHGQDGFEQKPQCPRIQANAERFDDPGIFQPEDAITHCGCGKADVVPEGTQAHTTIINQQIDDPAVDVVQG